MNLYDEVLFAIIKHRRTKHNPNQPFSRLPHAIRLRMANRAIAKEQARVAKLKGKQ
jgi:hypothetical protein